MANVDAKTMEGDSISRAEAVLRCCVQLVEQQATGEAAASIVYSQIIFNDTARCAFTRVDGETAAARLACAREIPKLGTSFSAAWSMIEQLEAATPSESRLHVIFLSDGRPGDLPVKLPSLGQEKDTTRSHGMESHSAPAIVRRLVGRRGKGIHVHAIAIGADKPDWMRRLVDIAAGGGGEASFMNPQGLELKLSTTQGTPSSGDHPRTYQGTPSSGDHPRTHQGRAHQPVVPHTASAIALPPTAATLGDAFNQISSSLTSSLAAGHAKPRVERTDDYEDSSAWRQNATDQTLWKGHKLVLNSDDDGHSWTALDARVYVRKRPFAHGGQRNAFHLLYEYDATFALTLEEIGAAGALCPLTNRLMGDPVKYDRDGRTYERAAIEKRHMDDPLLRRERLKLTSDRVSLEACRAIASQAARTCDHFVAKEGRYKEDWNERLRSHKISMRTAIEAQALAAQFNKSTPDKWPIITVLTADIYRLAPANAKVINTSNYRYLSVEPFLEGRYKKFNGNNGYVGGVASGNDRHQDGIAQCFTHWTYEHSLATTGSAVMVCDIQGVGYTYTDVTLCSEVRRFGHTDMGQAGFEGFFRTHTCNELCVKLGLTRVSAEMG